MWVMLYVRVHTLNLNMSVVVINHDSLHTKMAIYWSQSNKASFAN